MLNDSELAEPVKLTPQDFVSDQEVKWCPGCGDYSILKQVQTVLPESNTPKENYVFISGIGCSSRFTYYMDTYGMHGIHGRAAAIASGVKMGNPDLDVWVISGDGDALSIGGNHFIHFLRKNFNIKLLLFNNQIYGLTKGQYSPTSEKGKTTKTTPYGSLDQPFNPLELALGAKASFVARTLDRDPKHMQEVLRRAHKHTGGTFVEIYQNCPVFNDGTFFAYSDKETKKEAAIILEHGKPLVFGNSNELGIRLDGTTPVVVTIGGDSGVSADDLWIHDETDRTKATIIARFPDITTSQFPRPFGVVFAEERSVYEADMAAQIESIQQAKGNVPLNSVLSGSKTWQIF
ncbi:MAG: 2-oxoacid:ferredoxin oxidoreductase subunit beta [Chlorobi bacterium]|nr:MAG: 2-oxoacid:ferredoxin oxidoreductase subunit beta [Bacteroidota bacterium]MBE2265994.1 2-oxoacid:ferredoxin oxidoreductase subunit beta [Flavobacteriales bacterium]MBL1161436.1 2-oxoacid:ferredoxin oxidoreductase subunit beta [Chlorobiota bacterium]MBW7854007.1 2-oxoacid:ferredoxin oxidoreductase subunit beta [Candidatus Kapabacteria bacterium]MCC6331892.1 2-oxoacid:ferredoxin oxidoreductase subunit beta [Ignavibacteria bacterium]